MVVGQKAKLIAVAGNIGAGKTELTGFLSRRYNLTAFWEPHEENPYLADFYKDMKRWAFQSQVFFLMEKFRLHRQAEAQTHSCIIDRTLFEDAEVFAKGLFQRKCMSKRDFDVYWRMYETLEENLRPPDLMIYLRCPLKTLKKRIAIRGRAMEKEIPTSYLSRLSLLYEDWIGRYKQSRVLILETDQLDYISDLVHRLDLFKTIEQHL